MNLVTIKGLLRNSISNPVNTGIISIYTKGLRTEVKVDKEAIYHFTLPEGFHKIHVQYTPDDTETVLGTVRVLPEDFNRTYSLYEYIRIRGTDTF